MGYELNIRRADENNQITPAEWINYMESDPEFERIEEFSADLGNNEVLTVQTPNGGLWKSSNGEVPFTFYKPYGEITVKNPDNWIIEKMIVIANNMDAIVVGEEGEEYDEEYLNNQSENDDSNKAKKWWQFWR